MNNPDHISESSETIFWVKILKFFDADPGSGILMTLDPGWKNSDPGSTTHDFRIRICISPLPWFVTSRNNASYILKKEVDRYGTYASHWPSVMFIPGFGSRIRIFPIPDQNFSHPGSATENLSILTKKIVSELSEI